MSVNLNPSFALPALRDFLAHPETRAYLESLVRCRVPRSEISDVVQSVVCDALAANAPEDSRVFRPWLTTIARRRIADFYRARRATCELVESEQPGAALADIESRSVVRFLASGTPDPQTLEWLVRTGDGEKLEHIASAECLSPELVRQRVSRLRRWLRERWHAELAGAAVLMLGLAGVWGYWHCTAQPAAVLIAAEGAALDPRAVDSRWGGRWVLDNAQGSAPSAAARTLIEGEIGQLTLLVERGRLNVASPKFNFSTPLNVVALAAGRFETRIPFGPHGVLVFRTRGPSGAVMDLECITSPWIGTLRLRRQ